MKKNLTSLMLVLALFAMAPLATSCNLTVGAEDSDSASTDEKSDDEARPASQEGEDEDKDDRRSRRQRRRDKDAEKKKTEDAVPVEVAALSIGPIESVLRFSSNLEAESEVQVVSEASRRVTELRVEEGDRVRKGQMLIRLQDDEQKSMLAKATSQYDKAKREYERQKRLWDQQLISEEEFNNKTYELEQLAIDVADAERELSYTEVRAPIGGTITSRQVNLGDQITVGQVLFDIVDFDTLVALVYVPEKNLVELRDGLPARLTPQAAIASDYTGRIKRISPVVDPRSGTVKVTIDVGNQSGLRPGMYVDVDLVTATRADALLVPKRALIYDNDQMFVFRLGTDEEQTRRVERVLIEPLLSDKNNVLPARGLELGDQIVIAGQAGLKDGALVSLPGDDDKKDAEAPEGTGAEVAGDEDSTEAVIAEAN